jgi:hypothetical protein
VLLDLPNPILFSQAWTGFPDPVANHAEICNDTSTYKTLMIVGNRSNLNPDGSLGPRRVSIWDRLEVNGSMKVTGNLGSAGFDSDIGLPEGWGGGLHTWDVYAEGTIGCGIGVPPGAPPGTPGAQPAAFINRDGQLVAKTKNFVIDHPLDPGRRSLVHAAVEGPEHAVCYRGEGKLSKGRATVKLPKYFESLTRADGRTVHLTPVFEGDAPVSALAASRVVDGSFDVRTIDGSAASQSFFWSVQAVRADVDELEVQPKKSDAPGMRLAGDAGPPPSAPTTPEPATRRRRAGKATKRAPARGAKPE